MRQRIRYVYEKGLHKAYNTLRAKGVIVNPEDYIPVVKSIVTELEGTVAPLVDKMLNASKFNQEYESGNIDIIGFTDDEMDEIVSLGASVFDDLNEITKRLESMKVTISQLERYE